LKQIALVIIFLVTQNIFAQSNFENNGLYYFKKAYNFDINQKKDSAFYYYLKAKKQYKKEQNKYSQARVLLNISSLQREENDLIGSENSLIEALKFFEQLGKDKKLFICYNKLGILLKDSEQFNKAQNYYNKALEIAKKLKNTKFELIVLSNIAINYKAQKKYKKAIDIFNQILKHDSIANYPIKKTRALNYIAYCNFKLHKNDNLPNLFYKAKQTYKANKHIEGIITSNLHLAEYYLSERKKTKAKRLLDQALNMAKANKKNSNILLILKLLAKADTINASHYFSQYTKLTDSITKEQSLYRNQFARISYETQKKEQKIITQQATIKAKNKRQKLLFAIVILNVLSVFMLFFFYRTRQKQQRQLLIIKKLREKEDERNRLAGNVHDGLAGYLRKALNKVDNLNEQINNPALDEIGDTIETAYNKARNISQEYQKLNFDNITFSQHIRSLLIESEELYKFTINIEGINTINWSTISIDIKTEFYRILQEALINIHKHADATTVFIKFHSLKNTVQISIKDDGKGTTITKDFKNVGLANMESRVNDLNGKIKIISSKNNGFELIISTPI